MPRLTSNGFKIQTCLNKNAVRQVGFKWIVQINLSLK